MRSLCSRIDRRRANRRRTWGLSSRNRSESFVTLLKCQSGCRISREASGRTHSPCFARRAEAIVAVLQGRCKTISRVSSVRFGGAWRGNPRRGPTTCRGGRNAQVFATDAFETWLCDVPVGQIVQPLAFLPIRLDRHFALLVISPTANELVDPLKAFGDSFVRRAEAIVAVLQRRCTNVTRVASATQGTNECALYVARAVAQRVDLDASAISRSWMVEQWERSLPPPLLRRADDGPALLQQQQQQQSPMCPTPRRTRVGPPDRRTSCSGTPSGADDGPAPLQQQQQQSPMYSNHAAPTPAAVTTPQPASRQTRGRAGAGSRRPRHSRHVQAAARCGAAAARVARRRRRGL